MLVALRHERDAATQIPGAERDPVDPHRAGDRANPRPWIGSTGYDVEQGTLPRARGTHQSEHLTPVARARDSPEEDPSAARGVSVRGAISAGRGAGNARDVLEGESFDATARVVIRVGGVETSAEAFARGVDGPGGERGDDGDDDGEGGGDGGSELGGDRPGVGGGPVGAIARVGGGGVDHGGEWVAGGRGGGGGRAGGVAGG